MDYKEELTITFDRVCIVKLPALKDKPFRQGGFHHIVPLDPVLKDVACGALSGQILTFTLFAPPFHPLPFLL